MDKRLLESTEFYNKRYHNFSTLVIFPILIIIIAIIIYSVLGKRELVITANAEVIPSKIIERIQSSSEYDIVENYLQENKVVEKGETLLVYNHSQDEIQVELLKYQLETVTNQIEQIQLFKQGIENGTQTFEIEDTFGYSQNLNDYFAQIDVLRQDTSKEHQTVDNQNDAIYETRQTIESAIAETNDKLGEYQELKNLITNDMNDKQLSQGNSLWGVYETYSEQITENEEQSKVLKKQYLSEIETNIQQLDSAANTLEAQKAGAGAYIAKSTSLESKIESFKSEKLASIVKEITALEATKKELETKLEFENQLVDKAVIVAKENGILHLNNEVVGMSKVATGTVIAEIYPSLQESATVYLEIYIPTTDMIGIRLGQRVQMVSSQKSEKPLILTGNVKEIATSPTRTEQGNYFKTIAEVELSKEQADSIQYGFQGKVTIITGEKTFFNYYKDKILNKE